MAAGCFPRGYSECEPATMQSGIQDCLRPIAIRLRPGQDLRESLSLVAQHYQLQAAMIVTAVGSLKQAALRYAGASEAVVVSGPFEIVSLVGTLSVHGLHLHGAIASSTGEMLGGHIMPGCLVYTTVEIVLAELLQYQFLREIDPQTGYRELCIAPLDALDHFSSASQ